MDNTLETKNHLINVIFSGITAKDNILNNFDFTLVEDMYDSHDDDGVPIVYNFMYKYIKQIPKDKRIVTFSADPAISASTIAGNAERYITIQERNEHPVYSSNLKIIYLTPTSHLLNELKESEDVVDINVKMLSDTIILNLICKNEWSFTNHGIVLSPEQFILIGINDKVLNEREKDMLGNLNITYFSLDMLNKKGIKNIIASINDIICDDPVHVVFDMSVMDHSVAPCVTRLHNVLFESLEDIMKLENNEIPEAYMNKDKLIGLNIPQIREIFTLLSKQNITGVDITGYDFRITNKEQAFRITCEVAKYPLLYLLNQKEKKINIFNENSKILIWRPLVQKVDEDIGWFILRNVDLDRRERLLKKLSNDDIISHEIETDDGEFENILISATNLDEQEQKSFYDSEMTITDCVLFPGEKINMVFEMMNA